MLPIRRPGILVGKNLSDNRNVVVRQQQLMQSRSLNTNPFVHSAQREQSPRRLQDPVSWLAMHVCCPLKTFISFFSDQHSCQLDKHSFAWSDFHSSDICLTFSLWHTVSSPLKTQRSTRPRQSRTSCCSVSSLVCVRLTFSTGFEQSKAKQSKAWKT